jgi:hypothetical protein
MSVQVLDYFRLTPVSLQNSKKVEPLFASLYCIAALLRDVLPQSIFDFGKSEVGYFSTSLLCLHEPPPAFLIVFNPVNDCIRVSINNACQCFIFSLSDFLAINRLIFNARSGLIFLRLIF